MMDSKVSSILTNSSSSEDVIEQCCKHMDSLLLNNDSAKVQLSGFVDAILVDSVSVAVSRKVISHTVSKLKDLPNGLCLDLCNVLIGSLKLRLMSFEDQVTEVNQYMAEIYESQGDFVKAAVHLGGIPLENSQKNYSKTFKLQMYLKIAHFYLEGHDSPQAEIYINRASLLITASTETDLQVRYKQCYARVLDFRKKFLEAARRYSELSLEPFLSPTERNALLRHAILCAIIAPAGLHRSRTLAFLNKDERSQHFPFHAMLRNTQSGHLITKEQVDLFEKELAEHQQAKLPNGMSILEAAVMEHNVLAISNIYKSIKLCNLAELLRVPQNQGETVVGRMIAEKRINGHIDQIDQIVYFDVQTQPWDNHINVVCNKVNSVIDLLTTHEPAYTKEKLQNYGC